MQCLGTNFLTSESGIMGKKNDLLKEMGWSDELIKKFTSFKNYGKFFQPINENVIKHRFTDTSDCFFENDTPVSENNNLIIKINKITKDSERYNNIW